MCMSIPFQSVPFADRPFGADLGVFTLLNGDMCTFVYSLFTIDCISACVGADLGACPLQIGLLAQISGFPFADRPVA